MRLRLCRWVSSRGVRARDITLGTSDLTAGSPGTFDTAMIRLPDLAKLGVNAIEIMPLGQFAGSASTGYNPGYIRSDGGVAGDVRYGDDTAAGFSEVGCECD